MAPSAFCRKADPASVSLSLLVVRIMRVTPSLVSSLAAFSLMVDFETRKRRDASVKLPAFATEICFESKKRCAGRSYENPGSKTAMH
jgi:hypothetical protein